MWIVLSISKSPLLIITCRTHNMRFTFFRFWNLIGKVRESSTIIFVIISVDCVIFVEVDLLATSPTN